MSSVICLVPIYQNELAGNEKKSFEEFTSKVNTIPIHFIAPSDLDTTWYRRIYPEVLIDTFEEWSKQSIDDYNALLLNSEFYRFFGSSDYIFIFQTDAKFLGTKEQLLKFVDMNYDYFGAPWGRDGMRFINRVIPGAGHSRLLRILEGEVIARVGNGGVSLRKTSAMVSFLDIHKKQIAKWEKAEDLFIGYYGAKHPKTLHLPDVDTAYQFAAEMDMEQRIKVGQIPMAVHKWEKFFPNIEDYLE